MSYTKKTISLIALTSTVSCSTTKQDLYVFLEQQNRYSKYSNEIPSIERTSISPEGEINRPDNSRLATRIRNNLCKAKKVKVSMTGVLPRIPAGTPVDQIKKNLKTHRDTFTAGAPRIFFAGMGGDLNDDVLKNLTNKNNGNRQTAEKSECTLGGDTEAASIAWLKSRTPKTARVDAEDRLRTVFFYDVLSKKFYLAASDLDEYHAGILLGIRDRRIAESTKVRGDTAYSCEYGAIGEVHLLFRNYTFMPPDNNDIRHAINGRVDFWMQYVANYSSVTEKPTSDPQIIKYEVTLDFDRFCQYGKPLRDLVSQ